MAYKVGSKARCGTKVLEKYVESRCDFEASVVRTYDDSISFHQMKLTAPANFISENENNIECYQFIKCVLDLID